MINAAYLITAGNSPPAAREWPTSGAVNDLRTGAVLRDLGTWRVVDVHTWPDLAHLFAHLWRESGLRVIANLAFAFVPLVTGAAQVRHLWRYRFEPWRRLTPAVKARRKVAPPRTVAMYRARSRPAPSMPHYAVASHRER